MALPNNFADCEEASAPDGSCPEPDMVKEVVRELSLTD